MMRESWTRCAPLVVVLCLLGACQSAPATVTAPDEPDLEVPAKEHDEIYTGDDSGGSAMLRVQHSYNFGDLGFFDIDESFTIYILITPGDARADTPILGETEGFADVSITGLGTGGSHTTSARFPVSFDVNGVFYPYPRCQLTLEITELLALSEPVSMENTALGSLPNIVPSEDEVTFFPKMTFSAGGETLQPAPGLSVTLDSVVLVGDTGCVFVDSSGGLD